MNFQLIHQLVAQLAEIMTDKKLRLAVAESCTGGLIAACLTDIPKCSHWFERGFVTYSNLAKQQMLAVDELLIKQYGAVSSEVACAMAEGALSHSPADIALSVTGIAGPGGGSKDKPVGTVHFSWAASGMLTRHAHQLFKGNRQDIRLQSCYFALEELMKFAQAK